MKQLKSQLKIVELQAQMDELEKRPTSEHVLIGEKDGEDSGLEVKFQMSSNINALLKEIKELIVSKASYTITLPLHEKLSQKSIQISHDILDRINLVILSSNVILDPKHATKLFFKRKFSYSKDDTGTYSFEGYDHILSIICNGNGIMEKRS